MKDTMFIGIVGGGHGGLELLKLFHKSENVKIKYIVDVNPNAPALQEATRLGIYTSNDLVDCLKNYEVNYIFEATGVPKVIEIIKAHVPENKIACSSIALILINILHENQTNTVSSILSKLNNIGDEINYNSTAVKQLVSDFTRLAGMMKILSFNAAIEAVKAGDHGKGFGVVAMELKDSSDTAKTISTTIGDINSKNTIIVDDLFHIINKLTNEFQNTEQTENTHQ